MDHLVRLQSCAPVLGLVSQSALNVRKGRDMTYSRTFVSNVLCTGN